MPSHCYYSSTNAPVYQTTDIEVKWNWDVGTSITNTASTQTELDDIVCDGATSNVNKIPSAAGFTFTGSTTAKDLYSFMGIAISGAYIGNGLNAYDEDPFYVVNNPGGNSADICGDHVSGEGNLHYHLPPQCLSVASPSLASTTGTDCTPS